MIFVALSLSIVVAVLESLTYLGSFRAHLGIPAILLYFFSISLFFLPRPISKIENKIINNSLSILTVTFGILYIVLNIVESFHYPNYIFSTTHINLAGLEILLILSIIFYYLSNSLTQSNREKVASGILAGLVAVAILGFARLLPLIIRNITPILASPFTNYYQKMTRAYPGFYPAMMQVKALTRDDAIILLPPQGAPWVLEGNPALVSRFLYPRSVRNYDPSISVSSPNGYILIAKGSWNEAGAMEFGWPKNPVSAQRIWRFDLASSAVQEFSRDYNPASDTWDWGLIEAKHE